jgi:hypothetical protein
MIIAQDATVPLRRGLERRRRLPQGHRAALPVLHSTHPIAGLRVGVVDQVRRRQEDPEICSKGFTRPGSKASSLKGFFCSDLGGTPKMAVISSSW